MIKIDFSSKKVQLALRFFTYGVMALATIILSFLAVLYAMGYRFNKDFSFEQGGVAQFRTTPTGAMVFADDARQENTPSRAYLSPGSHNISMQLDGYRHWNRQVSLQPGQLLWLDYARFVPNTVKTTTVREFPSVIDGLASPDRRWILIQQQQNSPTFTLADVSSEKDPVLTELTIPETSLTKKDGNFGQFQIIEWSLDSRYILVRHTNGDVNEVLRIDRSNAAETVNIGNLFRLNIGEVHFSGNNANILYAQTSDVLRRLDIPAGNASAALVVGTKSFVLYGGDHIAYVAEREKVAGDPQTKQQVVGIYNGQETIVKTFGLDEKVLIDFTEYYRHQYLAIASNNGKVEILQDPTESAKVTPVEITYNGDIAWMKFSDNGRMLAAGNASSWINHDLELAHTSQASIEGNVANHPKWLDSFHFWAQANDKLVMMEFDGQNASEITDASGGLIASLSPNGRSLFSFKNNTLQSSRMIVE
ncbi:MAG TPA: PEGA domain-containing protein [Candidatus Saccharimonadales bacterium]|nr:PEGA domain-containing protein [Candidatus Saccharimonadales bacterium]